MCTPQTAEDFSATAYYFARALYQAKKVPIGIIQSSYGGSPVESWLPPQTLAQHPELKLAPDPKLPVVDFTQAVALQQTQVKNLMAWGPTDPARLGVTQGWQKPEFDDTAWATMELPLIWDKNVPSLGEVGGAWFRKEITIPAAWEGKDIMLKLGRIAWMDYTYWNGTQVGISASITAPPSSAGIPGGVTASPARW